MREMQIFRLKILIEKTINEEFPQDDGAIIERYPAASRVSYHCVEDSCEEEISNSAAPNTVTIPSTKRDIFKGFPV